MSAAPETSNKMGFFDHLDELRRRLMFSLLGVVVGSIASFAYVDDIFAWLRQPLDAVPSHKMIVLSPLELFMTELKLGLLAGVFIASPWILFQVWQFVSPGLYPTERRWVLPFVLCGSLFFVAGAAFSFYVVLPLGFKYLVGTMPASIETHYSVALYFSLVIQMLLAFGVVFELPLIMWIFAVAGLVTPAAYVRFRKYWIVLATIIAGVLTPPDPLSQVLMAIPLIGFFELGIIGSRLIVRRRRAAALAAPTG